MLKKLLSGLKKKGSSENRIVIDANAPIGVNGVLTEAFGIRIYDGSIAPFARAGDSYPAMGSYSFSTDEDFQDQITLEFHRSSESMASPESFIGQVRIRGYKLEGAREPLVRLYYEIANQQIAIWATNEKDNGELALSVIKNTEGQSVH
ncbi:hypothetical protein GJQ55_08040 [Venatoribacter cucullus]|jgi:molecular chaperone DnaK (HSP70)|uniref:Uncharacterized protein n=1 Tax=Venatoribacter cucullus TaxID=2661630 RepID=A0A9X7UYF6_9GAMM|nr:hypothetical protein [Venatoribacter cucullus]QQD24430.1 hypothetical protein GJQ55_08040 [Venatoribacter cucullus]